MTNCGNKKTVIQINPSKKENCKLSRIVEKTVAMGFPKVDSLALFIGKLNMTILFVDFDDVPAPKSVDSIFSIINPIVLDFFKKIPYNCMELNSETYL